MSHLLRRVLSTLNQSNTRCLDSNGYIVECAFLSSTEVQPGYQVCTKLVPGTFGPQSSYCWVLDPGCANAFQWFPRYLEFERFEIADVSSVAMLTGFVTDGTISPDQALNHSLYHVHFTGPSDYSGLDVLLTQTDNSSNVYALGGMSFVVPSTKTPSSPPSYRPTAKPSAMPTSKPTAKPSIIPTFSPSFEPTSAAPAIPDTRTPSIVPTGAPTWAPIKTGAPQTSGCDCVSFCALNPGVNTTNDNSWGTMWGSGFDPSTGCFCACTVAPTGQPSFGPYHWSPAARAPAPVKSPTPKIPSSGIASPTIGSSAPTSGGTSPVASPASAPTSPVASPASAPAPVEGPSAPIGGFTSQNGVSTSSVSSSSNALSDPTTGGIIIFFIVAGTLALIAAAYFVYRSVRGVDPKLARMRAAGRMSQDGEVVPSHGDAIDLSAPDSDHTFHA